MEKKTGMLKLFIFTLLLAIGVMIVLYILEKREKHRIRKRFGQIREGSVHFYDSNRSFPRLSIPDPLDVTLLSGENEKPDFKVKVINISASGFCIKSNPLLGRLNLNQSLQNVILKTPLNECMIREIKAIWILERVDRTMIGIQIIDIDEENFQKMHEFIFYLKEYLIHGK